MGIALGPHGAAKLSHIYRNTLSYEIGIQLTVELLGLFLTGGGFLAGSASMTPLRILGISYGIIIGLVAVNGNGRVKYLEPVKDGLAQ